MRPIPNIQVWNCEHKIRFSDEDGARAGTSCVAGKAPDGKLWIYKCRTCNGWHMTKVNHGNYWLIKQDQPGPPEGMTAHAAMQTNRR